MHIIKRLAILPPIPSTCILLLAFFFQRLSAQEYLNRDSLMSQLIFSVEDTNRVLLYISIGQQFENNHPDSAIYYYRQAHDLSEQIGYETGILKYFSNITFVYNSRGQYDTALILNLQSVELARKLGKPAQIAACLGNVANSYLYLEKYENAIDYFLQTDKLITITGNKQYQCVLSNNLSVIYLKLNQPDKSRNHAEKAIALATEVNDIYNLGISLDNMALTYIATHQAVKALPFLQQALDIAEQTENLYLKESILINFADAHLQMGEYRKIRPYAEEGMELARKLEDTAGESIASLGLGYYYLYMDQPDKALKYALQSEKGAASNNMQEQLKNAYSLLSYISLVRNMYFNFQNYQFKHDSIETLLNSQRITRNIQDFETKYETGKKIQQITQLEQEKEIQKLKIRQNQFLILALLGIIFTAILLSFLILKGNRQKQLFYLKEKEVQQIKINELEAEKQLLATEAVLKGQEEERTRLARDLHDSLGGMLSGINLSFNTLREILVLNPEYQQMFDRSLDMLDGAIVELRTIAHDLMPESLLKFGLDTSLRDYCDKINSSGTLKVTFQSIGMDNYKADQSAIITVYRIVQELITNTIKHATAMNLYVQLVDHNGQLEITVEDDGKGFDVNVLNSSAGIGWQNIRNRVEYLTGKIDVQSDPLKGTTVNIYI